VRWRCVQLDEPGCGSEISCVDASSSVEGGGRLSTYEGEDADSS